MEITLEVEERIIEHKFWVRLRTGKIVNDCMASRPHYEGRATLVTISVPHKDFGHVPVTFAAEVVIKAMENNKPLYV